MLFLPNVVGAVDEPAAVHNYTAVVAESRSNPNTTVLCWA